MFDNTSADRPSDVGAPIMTSEGKLSRGTELKFRALSLFARHLPVTDAITHSLNELKLFDDWPLSFEIEGRRLTIPDLLIVRQSAFEAGDLAAVVQRHGVDAARLLGLHRVSLFRVGLLMAAARSAIRSTQKRALSNVEQALSSVEERIQELTR